MKPEPELEEVISELQGKSKKMASAGKGRGSDDNEDDEMSEDDTEAVASKRARMDVETGDSAAEVEDAGNEVSTTGSEDGSNKEASSDGEDFEFSDDEDSAPVKAKQLPKKQQGRKKRIEKMGVQRK